MENNITEDILKKWNPLVEACKSYYIDSLPTGVPDYVYDEWEQKAIDEDGFYVRDYILSTYLPEGTKSKNKWVDKIKKTKVEGKTMLQAILDVTDAIGGICYCDLKYDGTSLAIYLDPSNGTPKRIVTVGNTKLGDFGVDKTAKFIHLIPRQFPKGIVAIQAEALVDTTRMKDLDPERARQKANGLVNSKFLGDEVDDLLTIRAYRYWCDGSKEGEEFKKLDYREALKKFPTVTSPSDGHITFCSSDTWTPEELKNIGGDYTETDKTLTTTGTFLNDGWVIYDEHGICKGALKFSGAGSGTEIPTTTVQSIAWNNQVAKGKDSWSANVIIDPIVLKGCTIKKPSAGSVSKLVKNNISPGAKVKVILANSTIPMVGDVIAPGNGDFQFPKCSCGYQMSKEDIYGSNLKCGNPLCKERRERMESYLRSIPDFFHIDLNKFLVIDRFKWETTEASLEELWNYFQNQDEQGFQDYLRKFVTTDLQVRNLKLVLPTAWLALQNVYNSSAI